MHRSLLMLVLPMALSSVVRVHAQPHAAAQLRYEAPSSCPDAATFRAHVRGQLGYDPFAGTDLPSQEVEVALSVDDAAARARMALRQARDRPAATRELTEAPGNCAALVATLASTLALALDPIAASTQHTSADAAALASIPPPLPAPARPPVPAPARPPVSAPASEIDPAPPPAARPAITGTAAAGPSASYGLVPAVGIGGMVAVGMRFGVAGLALEGRFDTTVGEEQVDATHGVEASAFTGGLLPCAHGSFYAVCLSVRLGMLQGRASGVSRPSLGASLLATVGAALRFDIAELSRVRLLVALDGGLPLVRTEFIINDRVAWTAAPVYGGLSLLAELRVW